MKISFSTFFATTLALILLGGGVFYFLPRNNCGAPQVEIEILVKKADSGDLDSIKALYFYNRTIGVPALAEYWALVGAKAGDNEMMQHYSKMFLDFQSNKKANVISQLKKDKSIDQCFLSYIESGASGQIDDCSKRP